MAPFKYDSIDLEGPAFRLVRIFSTSTSSEIECELFEAWYPESENGMPYEALSYTWGDLNKSATISVNGGKLQITQNLYEAIQHLRYADQDRILWIDGICIDQENAQERGHQVRHMSNIYKEADRVIVWLGLGTPGTDILMDFIHHQHKSVVKVSAGDGFRADQAQLKDEMERLLGHPWFTRIWILQEIASARRASIVCGRKTVSAQTFAIIPTLLEAETNEQCRAVLDIMPGGSRNNSWWSKSRTLRILLQKFSLSKASDDRDMVYALLNISSDACGSEDLTPDYTKSLESVLRDTLRFILPPSIRGTFHDKPTNWTMESFRHYMRGFGFITLMHAIDCGDAPAVEHLLEKDQLDLNHIGGTGMTPLCSASSHGNEAIVQLLLDFRPADSRTKVWQPRAERGSGALWRNQMNRTTNIYSKRRGVSHELSRKTVSFWPKDGRADPNMVSSSGRTPLSLAAGKGHEAVVKLLLANDEVEPDMQDRHGRTPLSWAVEAGHEAIVRELLRTKMVKTHRNMADGLIPLSLAATNGHWKVAKLLLEATNEDMNVFHRKEPYGLTPLTRAAANGYATVVEALLAGHRGYFGKLDLNYKDSRGITALFWAAALGHEDVVRILAQTDGIEIHCVDNQGRIPLAVAADEGHWDIVKLLLRQSRKNGQQENGELVEGRTLLSYALRNNHIELVKLLMDPDNYDLGIVDRFDWNTMMSAANIGDFEGIKLLLKSGRYGSDFAGDVGRDLLFCAVSQTFGEQLVEPLLAVAEYDPDCADYVGRTPLSYAASKLFGAPSVKLLLETGKCDLRRPDRFGKTPMDWAVSMRNDAVVEILNLHSSSMEALPRMHSEWQIFLD